MSDGSTNQLTTTAHLDTSQFRVQGKVQTLKEYRAFLKTEIATQRAAICKVATRILAGKQLGQRTTSSESLWQDLATFIRKLEGDLRWVAEEEKRDAEVFRGESQVGEEVAEPGQEKQVL
jgi:hypothetical protein